MTSFGRTPNAPALDRVSIELTNACAKSCSFCYNHSNPTGATAWTVDEIVDFVVDCAANGIKAASLGGGEPLQFPGLFAVLKRLDGVVFRSFTTNGLLLDQLFDDVVDARPDKVHVSLHFPERPRELARVIRQVVSLQEAGLRSGVNLLVRKSRVDHAVRASAALIEAGIGTDRIMFLPMRGEDTPTPKELATVAGTSRFQSMTCLLGCSASPRFASVGWDKQVAWCSYTSSRRPMPSLDFDGLMRGLTGLGLATC